MAQYQGVWTLQQQMQALTSGQWATDPNFKNTTLLLQADNAANSAQNNTFYDSSPNSFSITRNGNTTQGSFTPFSNQPGAWGNYFNGSSNLNATSNAAYNASTGDFCVEAWVYNTTAASALQVYVLCVGGISLYRTAAGYLEFAKDSVAAYATSTTLVPVNQWSHVAVTRSGTTLRLFIDGVQAASVTNSVSFPAGNLAIGSTYAGASYHTGYLSNVRYVVGSPVYTTNFTPSPLPLTAITNTVLLTCQSYRFVDNSTTANILSLGSTPQVQPFSPFAPQYQWTSDVIGGGIYLDGSGDYLNTPYNANLLLNGVDSTIECWFYPLTANSSWASGGTPGVQTIIAQGTGAVGGVWSQNFFISMDSTNLNFYGGGSGGISASTSVVKPFCWNHIAVTVTAGTSASMYVNGTSVASGAITAIGNNTGYQNNFFGNFLTGGGGGNNSYINGYTAGLRVIKGQKLASGNFTPPTAPVTATAVGWTGANAASSLTGTCVLLLSGTNAGIYDGTMKNNLETVGNAQVSTSVVKYGSGSMYFDGSGDYLVGPNSVNFDFGSGDFTIEFWINTTQSTAAGIVGKRTSSGAANTNWIILINQVSVVGNVVFYASDGSAYQVSALGGGLINNGVWHHVAVTRANSTFRVFVDGTQVATSTWTGAIASTSRPVYVGIDDSAAAGPFTGFLDDLRITKGIARYTQNFIPPSVALPRQ